MPIIGRNMVAQYKSPAVGQVFYYKSSSSWEHQRNLSAIDMEAYAVAEAACLAGESRIPWLVVKGIQDFADSEKMTNTENMPHA